MKTGGGILNLSRSVPTLSLIILSISSDILSLCIKVTSSNGGSYYASVKWATILFQAQSEQDISCFTHSQPNGNLVLKCCYYLGGNPKVEQAGLNILRVAYAAIPFFLLLMVALVIIVLFPSVVTVLPNMVGG